MPAAHVLGAEDPSHTSPPEHAVHAVLVFLVHVEEDPAPQLVKYPVPHAAQALAPVAE